MPAPLYVIRKRNLFIGALLLMVVSVAAGGAIQDWVDSRAAPSKGAKGCHSSYPSACMKDEDGKLVLPVKVGETPLESA